MKHFARYLITMAMVFLLLIVVDFILLVLVNYRTDSNGYFLSVEEVSNSITKEGNHYVMDEEQRKMLDERNAFVFVIGEDGNISWQYRKPDDVPVHYSLSDVAGFSRWYLCDYPVYTWTREDGILVIGLPKDSLWKYMIMIRLSTFTNLITVLPYVVICNLLTLFLLPLWITKGWEKRREKKRSEWIAGVSHDIRTPLSIVMGHSEKGSIIQKQCIRIKDLISNLNTENKLEAGTGKWNDDEIKIAALMRDVVCDYVNLGEEQYSFELYMDNLLEGAVIIADESLVRRMVDNLISNSIHHNEQGCEIKITMSCNQKNRIQLRIADNGIGVTEEKLREMNSRLKYDYLPEHGLGIRVVKQIARKYRYKTVFKSEKGRFFECDILLR